MTLQEMRDALESSIHSTGTILLRPTGEYGFVELEGALVLRALDDLVRKIPLVQAGLDDFTAPEKLLFVLLQCAAERAY